MVIARQSKSPAAEAAVRMNVFQMDTESEAIPKRQEIVEEAVEEVTPEPVKRESTKTASVAEKDVSSVVKKWAKK